LHPAVILVGTLMGASLGGFVGLLLAAPVLATLKLLGRYAWHKMLDMPPFDDDDDKPEHKASFDIMTLLSKLVIKVRRPGSLPSPITNPATPPPPPLDDKADV
jgi:hypothetical protein